ncbi:MAG: N-acetylmuramoyl-L-alanine amidase [Lachnospiraceae bacterium]|nr:N-acetylmuramoyl-L-alanine amidase [Lachnospiraceae bacterium]
MKHFTFITILLFSIFLATANVFAKDADGDYVILIDPGHGSIDSGSISTITGDWEADINWDIALALKAELQTYEGVKVYLSRGCGEYQSNIARAYVGKQLNADYNISVHINSYTVASVSGVVAYGTIDSRYKADIERLCRMISANVHELGIPYYKGGYDYRAGTYNSARDYYTFLEASSIHDIPSVIIEHAFLSNYNDAMYLHKKENRYKVGEADAKAIAKFLNLSKRTVSPDSSITLTRTYSALVSGLSEASYESSDSSIVHVSDDGIITAMKPGTATISCTSDASGTQYIEVTVPEIEFVRLTAGLIQRCYRTQAEAFNYKKNCVVVQAIYSDGSVRQIREGYTLGNPSVGEVIDAGTANEMTFVNVPVTYNGHSTMLKFFYFYHSPGQKNRISTPLEEAVVPLDKANKDIALAPGSFVAGEYGSLPPVIPPVEEPTTVAPTQQATSTTDVPTQTPIVSPSQEASTPILSEVTSSVEATSATPTVFEDNDTPDIKVIIIVVSILSIIAISMIVGIIFSKKKHNR